MKKRFDLGLRVGFALPMRDRETKVEEDFFVGITEGRILEARRFKASDKKECRKFLERKNMVLLPGLVNAHTHLAMTLFRGLEDDLPLKTWLFDRILPLERELVTPEFVKAGLEIAARECIRFGTTTVNDMYFFTELSAKFWDQKGLRGYFCQAFSELPLPEDKFLKGSHGERFLEIRSRFRKNDRIQIGLGPHAPYTCSDETLRRAAELSQAEKALLHIHVSEAEHEVPDSIKKYGMTPVERLAKLGALSPRTICAHSVHLSDSDIELYRQYGSSPIYNPDSNAKLASGVAPIPKYIKAGIPVALGTDGSASNNDLSLFGAMDLGIKIQKLFHHDSMAMTGADALRMATIDGARALGLDHEIGSIEVGKAADLVCVDLDFPHLQPVHDVVSQLVYAAQGLEVDTVICAGRMLLKDKIFVDPQMRKLPSSVGKFRRQIQNHLKSLR